MWKWSHLQRDLEKEPPCRHFLNALQRRKDVAVTYTVYVAIP